MNGGHGHGATSSEMRKIGRKKERRKKEGRKETEEEGVGVWKFAWGGAARDRPHACMAHFPRALSPLYFSLSSSTFTPSSSLSFFGHCYLIYYYCYLLSLFFSNSPCSKTGLCMYENHGLLATS